MLATKYESLLRSATAPYNSAARELQDPRLLPKPLIQLPQLFLTTPPHPAKLTVSLTALSVLILTYPCMGSC